MSIDQVPAVTAGDSPAESPEWPNSVTSGDRRERGRSGRRSRRARHPGRRRVLVWSSGVAVAAVTVWWVGWSSPLTLVEHVAVDAPSGISEKLVRKASGIAATDHVPAVDAARVRANVMAALPAVAEVRVKRSLPHTVTVTVTPRIPFAALPRGDRYLVVDSGGVQFDDVGSPGKLPVLQGLSVEGGVAALAVLNSLPKDLLADVRAVRATTHYDVDLTLSGGATVRWGSPDETALKAKVLAGLRSVKAGHYDVSAPMMPTTLG